MFVLLNFIVYHFSNKPFIIIIIIKKNFQKFSFVRPANEKRRKSAGFQDFSEIFFLHGQLLPPYSICGLTLILGGIKKPKKGKI